MDMNRKRKTPTYRRAPSYSRDFVSNHLNKEEVQNIPLKEIQTIIDSFEWKYAKSYPKHPHWYTVRQSGNEFMNDRYNTLYWYIYHMHRLEYFYRKAYKVLDMPDGYTYWIMTDDITDSVIINRRKT